MSPPELPRGWMDEGPAWPRVQPRSSKAQTPMQVPNFQLDILPPTLYVQMERAWGTPLCPRETPGLWNLSISQGHVLHTVPATWNQSPAYCLFFNLINLFLASLDLHCCPKAFSHCRGGWTSCRGQALGHMGSVVVAHGLNCSEACGIVQDQGSNLCLLHKQVASLPRDHQGSPVFSINDVVDKGTSLVWVEMEGKGNTFSMFPLNPQQSR